MAAVYLGRRTGEAGSSYVAIKVVHPRFADDPAFVAMFLDEARLSARIQHPNVVRVEATGEADGLYYMVMEYLHGAPLQRFVRRLAEKKRVLLHEVIVHIVAATAAGLHAAHETKDERGQPLGIVHRDVTPQNILVSYGGGVKLIDFGIAKAAGRVHQTAKGLLKGKLRYMAPEQAAGRPIDRRTDVYALGIVLWEMLTYKKAFSAKTDAELIRLVLSPKIIAPSRLTPSVTPALDEVAMTALAPSPDERFQTALAFRNALLAAVPAAQRVDDAELASLLRLVLADDLANDARTLPPSVVVSAPHPVGAPSHEEAMTQVVPSLVPDDDEPESTPPPREPRPTPFGIGLSAPMPPAAVIAVAPTPSPSMAPAAIAATRLSLPGPAAPAPALPARSIGTAPAASFTPPNAIARPVIPAHLAPAGPHPDAVPAAAAPPTRSAGARLMRGCSIVLAVLLTISIGSALGWLALHHATQAMSP